ncbi:Cell shape-determining protein MreC [uncultured Alphaproteobacteria bacterium]|uniref:Cell shape-determining protein MreC n=1 Tax=uncultured Alphaproteobacteria bacterium TaxID=91750 RepID=A0A212K744_9PROT|nr:Cell shape-determining protein MreC [uncultured Alphaproteobacteria bacterium]
MKGTAVTGRWQTARLLLQRFAFVALVGAAFALMLLGKADTILVERVRAVVVDAMAPVIRALSQPAGALAEISDNVRDLANLRAENARLREENAQLLRWRDMARRLEAENGQFQSLLDYLPPPEARSFSIRVMGDTGGAFAHSVLVAAGGRDNVRKGMAVLSGDGLVGRVAQVGRKASRVVLITDITSRVPVVLESTRTRAILAGNNSEKPRLIYVPAGARVAPGDRVVTSGHAGAFPPGIPVGVVSSVDDTVIRVQPFMDRDRLEIVRVVDYGLSGILGSLDEETRAAQAEALKAARERGKAQRLQDAQQPAAEAGDQ